MKFKKSSIKKVFILRLERGEEIHATLKKFCKQNKIEGGIVRGIGAVSYARVYSVTDSENFIKTEREFYEPMELVSATGNISFADGKHLIHMHVALGRKDKNIIGGHLLEGVISFTGEFFILQTDRIPRKPDGELMLFKL